MKINFSTLSKEKKNICLENVEKFIYIQIYRIFITKIFSSPFRFITHCARDGKRCLDWCRIQGRYPFPEPKVIEKTGCLIIRQYSAFTPHWKAQEGGKIDMSSSEV